MVEGVDSIWSILGTLPTHLFQRRFFKEALLLFYHVIQTNICEGVVCVWIHEILNGIDPTKLARFHLRTSCLANCRLKCKINLFCALLSVQLLRVSPVGWQALLKILVDTVV